MQFGSEYPGLDIAAAGPGRHELIGSDNVVGSGAAATVRIDDPTVADMHARLSRSADGVVVTDLGSDHGTYVNGLRITEPTLLRDGDTLGFGTVTAGFSAPRHSGLEPEGPIGGVDGSGGGGMGGGGLGGGGMGPPPADDGPVPPGDLQGGRADLRGTVVRSVPPSQGNPQLVVEVRTDDGRTVTLRRSFLTPFGVPHLAEGHHIRVDGDLTREGWIRPRRIVNESTSETWRGAPRALLIVAALVLAALAVWFVTGRLVGDTGPPVDTELRTVPAVSGQQLEQARATMREAGFVNVVEIRERSSVPLFVVTRTMPPAGVALPRETRVDLYYSFPL